MEHSFYNDSLYNYLVIPAEGTENYQYRMLAVNRIAGLLPCNIRTIDGKSFLYYDITSKQSLEEICERPLSAENVRKLLYAIVNAGTTLSDYLLDDNKLLLCSEYIFYDYETDDFMFMYYPDEAEGTSAGDLFEYLCQHIEPSEKRTMYILYRLCELSSMKNFILKKEFLEKEYENDRHSIGENDKKTVNPGLGGEVTDDYLNERESNYISNRGNKRAYDRGGNRRNEYISDQADYLCNGTNAREEKRINDQRNTCKVNENEDMDVGQAGGASEYNNKDKKDRKNISRHRENKLMRILGTAIIFLILAVASEWAATNLEIAEEYRRPLLIMVLVFLSLAILTALIGTILTFFNGRKELKEEEKRIEKQKKNELIDTMEYESL